MTNNSFYSREPSLTMGTGGKVINSGVLSNNKSPYLGHHNNYVNGMIGSKHQKGRSDLDYKKMKQANLQQDNLTS